MFERYGDFTKLDGLPGISWYLVARASAIEHILGHPPKSLPQTRRLQQNSCPYLLATV
jgi:hypothetical protein